MTSHLETEQTLTSPIVFISYSHDSQEHKQWVLELASRLRQSGVDAILDQWELGPGGDLPHFMEQSIARSARVLMICTERYVDKANAGIGGVGYEKMIVTADLLKQIGSNRVIPIIRQGGPIRLPTFLGSKVYTNLSTKDSFETGIDELLRELLNAPLFVKPPIGTNSLQSAQAPEPTNPTPVTQFMRAVAAVYDRSDNAGALRTEWIRGAMGTTSKLFFDHARDQAISLDYVDASDDLQIIWVQEAGRLFLVRLERQE